MATATLTSQLTDTLLNPGSPTNIGTANAQASETVINLEGANAAATGHSGSVGPASPSTISQFRGMYSTVTGFTRTDMHLHIWVRDLYPIRNVNVGGISFYVFGSSEAIYYMDGIDKGYLGDYTHLVLNLDAGDRPAASLGTAPSTNITRVGYAGNISASKAEAFLQNCYFDAVRRGTGGQGITFRGGLIGDRLTFADCATADSASYGLLKPDLTVEGPLIWGVAAQETWLDDNLKTLKFKNFTVNNGAGGNTIVTALASDYYRIIFANGTTGVTNITLVDVTWQGVSRNTPFSFNTSALSNGDAFISTRGIYIFGSTITFGAQSTSSGDRFIECVTIVPNGITLTNPIFSNCNAVTLIAINDVISGGQTQLHSTAINIPFVTSSNPSDITGHLFDNTAGTGHAIEFTSATAAGAHTLTGVRFTGYGGTPGSNLVSASGNSSAAIYNNSGKALTISIAGGGDTPSVRNGIGATTIIVNNTQITLSGLNNNTEVTVLTAGTQTVLDEIENTTGDYAFTVAAAESIDIFIHHVDFLRINDILAFTVPGTDITIPVSQITDNNFLNPV